MEKKLKNYIQAINEIAKSKIANYKAKSLMNDNPFYDHKNKIDALEDFIKEIKLNEWAESTTKIN